jgi:hypothetical protein
MPLTSWIKEDYLDALGKDGNEVVNLIRENIEKMDTLIRRYFRILNHW